MYGRNNEFLLVHERMYWHMGSAANWKAQHMPSHYYPYGYHTFGIEVTYSTSPIVVDAYIKMCYTPYSILDDQCEISVGLFRQFDMNGEVIYLGITTCPRSCRLLNYYITLLLIWSSSEPFQVVCLPVVLITLHWPKWPLLLKMKMAYQHQVWFMHILRFLALQTTTFEPCLNQAYAKALKRLFVLRHLFRHDQVLVWQWIVNMPYHFSIDVNK